MTIRISDVISKIMEPVGPLAHTVDGLEAGEPDSEVRGIVTTFMATQEVIEQAVAAGANLIISHEASFYCHQNPIISDHDPVYAEKLKLITESGIAIYRCHDYVHRYNPDGITAGLLRALGWDSVVDEHKPAAAIVTIPAMTVRETAEYVKGKLGISYVRTVGDLSAVCTRIGLSVGYRGGGALSIPLFEQEKLDLIITGEGPEWETPEYVRDAAHQGKKKALILLGHAQSEEPGMKALAARLEGDFPDIRVRFISGKHSFQII
ncbi:Nif3-like dinuclear metal center hexameric protein [Paenibacillus harenae]|uniref:Nif3-like dinuclear metal center hexameric protein n=1 Tax=Paenibacillus harenae TaxID=306543 RepID=UPI00040FE948|nr:Nif3-like dinuclear metal center hexameric protein [Paenibacillus harenae]